MQGTMDVAHPPTSPPPPTLPPPTHTGQFPQPTPSRPVSMHRSKLTTNRTVDGATSRLSDEDAKTAVRVAVRVRPSLKSSDPGFELIPQRFRESTCEVPSPNQLSVQSPQGRKLFVFDRVFDESATQEKIWDYLSDSVSSFVKGYNVSILAYGQSGAGKSYTMGTSGPEDQHNEEIMGIVPRAAQALFEKLNGAPTRQSGIQTPKRYSTQTLPTLASLNKLNGSPSKNWELRATYVEIYNEQLRDLLVPENVPHADRGNVAIREDTKGRILLTGLTQVPINSVDELLSALNFGSSIRQTDATAINARSSRSHAVFSLNLVQKKAETASAPTPKLDRRLSTSLDNMSGAENVVTIDSKLHFVDLAGSERLKNTGATGDRAKEGISINAGLASLGKVISQLSSRHANAHISYRDSRLTRLLQDSLGGNAVTFMVACVTPAIFHLSETLNTVTYAQRARAIQSKPEIQQSHEDNDKQAVIDRLRAEVSFLRDQIRHSETSDRRGVDGSKSEKGKGHEAELQTQIMDMQENYNALTKRHAKLAAELSKARDSESVDTPLFNAALGDNATERVKRSNSFAQAAEAMVMEYEKTIQTLESSLSNTRSSLSNSESTLMEKETRIAYMETIQQQLQSRIQKAVDREQSNESYLRDLEMQMEGTTSGEERSAAVIAELRRELIRVRESENSGEDYISTLEERLADAEQDQESMQREIDRLEHVVERQRSIGRLDNLLGELDGIHQGTTNAPTMITRSQVEKPKLDGHHDSYDPYRPSSMTDDSTADTQDDDFEDARDEYREPEKSVANGYGEHERSASSVAMPPLPTSDGYHSPAQNDIMADKVENLTQELFDLRSEHETHLVDYDHLQQKYQTALETLAKLQYDEETPVAPPTPTQRDQATFLADAGMKEEEKVMQGQPSSSRSLSAALSSHGRSNGMEGEQVEDPDRQGSQSEQYNDEIAVQDDVDEAEVDAARGNPQKEMELLKRLHAEKEVSVTELTNTYKSLAQRHEATLQQVEDLRHEVQRARDFRPASPSFNKPILRRKSDDVLSYGSDRASRSFASLKNIALDHFESRPDTRQSFELNLNTVMTELHGKSERVHSLEAELATVRKEIESKQTIISGLTRERSTMKGGSSGVDFSVVGQMRDQLMESENQIRALHEQHTVREKEFQDQIDSLKATLSEHQRVVTGASNELPAPREENHMPGDFPETPAVGFTGSRELGAEQAAPGAYRDTERAEDIARLQSELAAWETKHQSAMESMKASEAKLLSTIHSLESSMPVAEPVGTDSSRDMQHTTEAAAAAAEDERQKHKQIVDTLQKEVDNYKATASQHVSKLEQLEQSYATILKQVDDDSKSRDLSQKELKTHKDLVANLENQLQVHKSAVAIHQESLESLQASHSQEIQELKSSMTLAEQTSKQRQAELEEHHSLVIQNMEADLTSAQRQVTDLLRGASSALGFETSPSQLHTHINGLVDEGKELQSRHFKATNELKLVQEELQNALNNTVQLENKIGELKMLNEEALLNMQKVGAKEKKSARLVEELEEQLNSSFDSHQQVNNRLSTYQSETVQARMEIERELEEQKLKNSVLEQQIAALKRQSMTSNTSANFNRESLSPEAAAIALARSGSQTSTRQISAPNVHPTPPPSIPLPPLPNSPETAQMTATPPMPNGFERARSPHQRAASPMASTSPPGSRHASKDVGPGMSQLVEEQEARIRTIEKHLFAEKQLTATLEEALVDLETSANRTKSEMDGWRKKCTTLEDEVVVLRKERSSSRASLQAVEEEREMRVRAERARQALEQRMMELNATKKKKKNALNCF